MNNDAFGYNAIPFGKDAKPLTPATEEKEQPKPVKTISSVAQPQKPTLSSRLKGYESTIAALSSKIEELENRQSSQTDEQPAQLKHRSELLDIMNAAIAEYWENNDPENPPKQESIKGWLKENYPYLAAIEIDAIDLIMRPNRHKRSKTHLIKY